MQRGDVVRLPAQHELAFPHGEVRPPGKAMRLGQIEARPRPRGLEGHEPREAFGGFTRTVELDQRRAEQLPPFRVAGMALDRGAAKRLERRRLPVPVKPLGEAVVGGRAAAPEQGFPVQLV